MRHACVMGDIDTTGLFLEDAAGWRHSIDGTETEQFNTGCEAAVTGTSLMEGAAPSLVSRQDPCLI
jgi:hypothetical protein